MVVPGAGFEPLRVEGDLFLITASVPPWSTARDRLRPGPWAVRCGSRSTLSRSTAPDHAVQGDRRASRARRAPSNRAT